MAVFTDITDPRYREQLTEVEKAFAITITSAEEISAGSCDTKFMISTQGHSLPLVLTIHETPDVSAAGKSSRASINMLHYVDYLSEAVHQATDRFGVPVNINILKPITAHSPSESDGPYLELEFEGVKKPISIVPFVRGKSFENSPEELAKPEEATSAGRALAAFLKVAKHYPDMTRFESFDFQHYVSEINRLSKIRLANERLGYVLSGGRLGETKDEDLGQAYISEMNEMGRSLLDVWQRLEREELDLTRSLINGDFFTDHCMIDGEGRLIMLDFSQTCIGPIGLDIGIAINSWASQYGRPVMINVINFLEAFDSVIPLNGDALSLIPTFAQIGAFRWETFRIQRMEMQDPRQHPMRSPKEFQSLRHGWLELQETFDSAVSVKELTSSQSH